MNFKFDCFNKLEKPNVILQNPDGKDIAFLETYEINIDLKIFDPSELHFKTRKRTTNSQGKRITYSHYKDIKTDKLVFVEGIGVFVISDVNDVDEGYDSYKEITAYSLERRLRDFGFFAENRVYTFYNPSDTYDSREDMEIKDGDESFIPSILGQLHKQAGIEINLTNNPDTDNRTFTDWTITYIEEALKYDNKESENIVRTIPDGGETTVYSFLQEAVTNTFEVMFLYDTIRKSIQVKFPKNVAKRSNIYLSHQNLINELATEERNEDIATVLNCTGNGIDIRSINSTGTSYICDFSYYMDEVKHSWMSQPLIDKLKAWQIEVEAKNPEWTALVTNLREKYQIDSELQTENVYIAQKLLDFKNLINQYTYKLTNKELTGDEITTAEVVDVGQYSFDEMSSFNTTKTAFDRDIQHFCYKIVPELADKQVVNGYTTGKFQFSGTPVNGTFNENYLAGTLGEKYEDGYLYFSDGDDKTYCKLEGETYGVETEPGKEKAEYRVKGFTRYTIHSNLSTWNSYYVTKAGELEKAISDNQKEIDSILKKMDDISSRLNVQKYLTSTPALLKELRYYWKESSYENSGIAKHENTLPEEEIDLAKELLEKGKEVLANCCMPTVTLRINSINFLKLFQFKSFTRELELATIITVEKSESVHYYPMLTSMRFSLDDSSDFDLTFSNNLKGEYDTIKSFAEKANYAADVSKKVESNWNNLTEFNRKQADMYELLYNPLSQTLHVMQGNAHHQAFQVGDDGIVLQQFTDDSHTAYEPEAIRMINNVIVFSDDNFKTCRLALGKIFYKDYSNLDASGNPKDKQAYGLAADAIIGGLILGNTLVIANKENTISLDEKGIFIYRPIRDGEVNDTHQYAKQGLINVFRATTNGDLFVGGYAKSKELEDLGIDLGKLGGQLTSLGDNLRDEITDTEKTLNGKISSVESGLNDAKEKAATDTNDLDQKMQGLVDGINDTIEKLGETFEGTVSETKKTLTTYIDDTAESTKEGILAEVSKTYLTVEESGDFVQAASLDSKIDAWVQDNSAGIVNAVSGTYYTQAAGETLESEINTAKGTLTDLSTKIEQIVAEDIAGISLRVEGVEIESSEAKSTADSAVLTAGAAVTSASEAKKAVAELDAIVFKDTDTGKLMSAIEAHADFIKLNANNKLTLNSPSVIINAEETQIAGYTVDDTSFRAGTGNNMVGMSHNLHDFSFWAGGDVVETQFNASTSFTGTSITVTVNKQLVIDEYFSIKYTLTPSGRQATFPLKVKAGSTSTITQFLFSSITGNAGQSISNVIFEATGNNSYAFSQFNPIPYSVTNKGKLNANSGSVGGVEMNDGLIQCTSFNTYTPMELSNSGFNIPNANEPTVVFNSGQQVSQWGTTISNAGIATRSLMNPYTSSNISCKSGLEPDASATRDLGTSSRMWRNTYCAAGAWTGSDGKLKNTIATLSEDYSALINALRPVTYKLNDGTSGRTHVGLIADEVKSAMGEVGINPNECAIYGCEMSEDGENISMLRYEELIPICIAEIQKLKKEIAALKATDL